MFTRKKICLCLCMLIALLSCFCLTASAAAYTDIQDHWARTTIEKWSDAGILSGYPDGRFNPNGRMTKGELAAVLYKIWGVAPLEDHISYPDLPRGAWYEKALTTMNMYHVAVSQDGLIRPSEHLTREEAMYMICEAFFVQPPWPKTVRELKDFPDQDQISPQFRKQVEILVRGGLVNGSASGRLNPKGNITRAEVLTILNQAAGLYITKPGTYKLNVDEMSRAAVTCGGVTLRITGDNVTSSPTIRLIGEEANSGSVTLQGELGKSTSRYRIGLYSVCGREPVWKETGNIRGDLEAQISPQTFEFPDTRFSGGWGTEVFPYTITTKEQFELLEEQNTTSFLTAGYEPWFCLGNDLDLGSLSLPYGAPSDRIYAHLDGRGHTITYRLTNSACDVSCAGLFRAWQGKVQNLDLAGTLDVAFTERATLTDATNHSLCVGGFSGWFFGEMVNCTSRMDITGRYSGSAEGKLDVGGLVGYTLGAFLRDCAGQGTVKGVLSPGKHVCEAGGVLGVGFAIPTGYYYWYGGQERCHGAALYDCEASGQVSVVGGEHTTAGGLVGTMTYGGNREQIFKRDMNRLRGCSSTAAVSSASTGFQSDCGGLVGHLELGRVQKSWAKPTVTINGGTYQNIGAITGGCYDWGEIEDCWASAGGCAVGAGRHTGGITGRLVGKLSNCFTLEAQSLPREDRIVCWRDTQPENCADFTGLSQAARTQFLQSCGWDFEQTWDSSGDLPILRRCGADPQRIAQG